MFRRQLGVASFIWDCLAADTPARSASLAYQLQMGLLNLKSDFGCATLPIGFPIGGWPDIHATHALENIDGMQNPSPDCKSEAPKRELPLRLGFAPRIGAAAACGYRRRRDQPRD
jgi:hypothetical protein